MLLDLFYETTVLLQKYSFSISHVKPNYRGSEKNLISNLQNWLGYLETIDLYIHSA